MTRQGRGLSLLVDERRVEAAIWRNHLNKPSAESRLALFEHYRPMARRLAQVDFLRVGGHGIELADFEQLAIEGLLQALDRFDVSRDVPFVAYATPRIRGSMRNGLAKASEAAAQYSYQRRVERDRLRSLRAGAEPSPDPLTILADLTVKLALGALLEEAAAPDPDELASDEPSAYETLAWNQLVGELGRRLGQLPKNEAIVLEQHYRNGLAFKQIAQLLGLSQGRISQIHAQALDRLRRHLPSQR